MAVATYTKSGTKATTAATLNKKVFGVEVKNHDLLKQAYLAYLANGRDNFAKTKKRGEVRGGGIKPWRQKGTGRARFGSSRNPIWTGGGVAFGPTGLENYSKKLNVAAKRQAIRQALTLAAKEDRIKVIETFTCPDGKVKPTINLLSKIGAEGNVLVVVSQKDDLVERATRNLSNVLAVQANYLNVFDVSNADVIVISRKALDLVDEWLGQGSAK
jgi:large subunit ribosomal protein L4